MRTDLRRRLEMAVRVRDFFRTHQTAGATQEGAVAKLEAIGESLPAETRAVILETHQLVSIDSSGLDALVQLHRNLGRQGVRLLVCALNEQPRALMRQAELDALIGLENIRPDLASAVAAVTDAPAAAPRQLVES